MNKVFPKIAAALAFGIGVMAIYAGGNAFLAKWPDFAAVNWLTYYNLGMGVITVALTAPLIWKNSRHALKAALATLAAHLLVTMYLQTAMRDVVSADSLSAMSIRITVWVIVLTFMLIRQWGLMGKEQKDRQVHRL